MHNCRSSVQVSCATVNILVCAKQWREWTATISSCFILSYCTRVCAVNACNVSWLLYKLSECCR